MIGFLKQVAPLIFYLTFVLVALISLTGKVQYGLYFLVPLLPLQNVVEKIHYYPFGKDFNDILILGMFFGWFISKASKREKLVQPSLYNYIFPLYLIFTYMTLWAGSRFLRVDLPLSPADPRVQLWKNYMLLPTLFFITFNNLKDVKQFKILFGCMCASMFLMNYYNVAQVRYMTSWISRTKVTGTFMWLGANEVAAFYATYTFVLLGVFLFFTFKNEIKEKIGLGILILMNFFIVLFMFSRAAYLASFMAMGVVAIMKKRILIIPMLVCVLCWQFVLPERVVQRIEFSEQDGELDDSAATRLLLWEQSLAYFYEHPVMGIGFNVFSKLGMKRDAHNVYMRTLAEQGLIGLFFLLLIMFLALFRSWRLYRRTDDRFLKGLGLGFFACTVSVMVGNFFGDRWTPLPLAAHFWVFLGMVERGNILVNQAVQPVQQEQKESIRRSYGPRV